MIAINKQFIMFNEIIKYCASQYDPSKMINYLCNISFLINKLWNLFKMQDIKIIRNTLNENILYKDFSLKLKKKLNTLNNILDFKN